MMPRTLAAAACCPSLRPPRAGGARELHRGSGRQQARVQRHAGGRALHRRVQEIQRGGRLRRRRAGSSKFDVQIDLASEDSKDKDRDQTIKGPDIFDVAKNPTAHYVTKSIAKSGAGYSAQGSLTLHGVTKEVPLDLHVQHRRRSEARRHRHAQAARLRRRPGRLEEHRVGRRTRSRSASRCRSSPRLNGASPVAGSGEGRGRHRADLDAASARRVMPRRHSAPASPPVRQRAVAARPARRGWVRLPTVTHRVGGGHGASGVACSRRPGAGPRDCPRGGRACWRPTAVRGGRPPVPAAGHGRSA